MSQPTSICTTRRISPPRRFLLCAQISRFFYASRLIAVCGYVRGLYAPSYHGSSGGPNRRLLRWRIFTFADHCSCSHLSADFAAISAVALPHFCHISKILPELTALTASTSLLSSREATNDRMIRQRTEAGVPCSTRSLCVTLQFHLDASEVYANWALPDCWALFRLALLTLCLVLLHSHARFQSPLPFPF